MAEGVKWGPSGLHWGDRWDWGVVWRVRGSTAHVNLPRIAVQTVRVDVLIGLGLTIQLSSTDIKGHMEELQLLRAVSVLFRRPWRAVAALDESYRRLLHGRHIAAQLRRPKAQIITDPSGPIP